MNITDNTVLSNVELLKQSDPTLGGTIGATLAKQDVDRFSEDDYQFLKFHGIYQQDDRDKRKTGKQYILMVRAKIPGGFVPPAQYLAFDALSQRHGNDTLRITTRQSFQFHGVVKRGLGPLMKGIHDALATTMAACGDVCRNVMAPPTPAVGPLAERVLEDARRVSAALLPATRAYHEIWVEGKALDLGSGPRGAEPDPLYGPLYLPRKFKVAFAIPPLNDIDVFTNCLGFVAVPDPADPAALLGYNLLAGGGQGMSHGNAETFPRVADVIGFLPAARVVDAAKAVLMTFRDYGDRANRKHARLKYVLAERGPDWFRAEVEARAGFTLEAPRPFAFARQGDLYGWHRQHDGRWFLGLYVEAGRIRDSETRRFKSALRQIIAEFKPEVRLTPNQNLLLSGVAESDREAVTRILADHGVPVENQAAAVRRAALACPALPTCGLALAESERALPGLLDRLEALFAELGLGDEEITVRMTGCPNGCARPFMAEIALVGRAPGKYNLYLGGNLPGTRLNREYRPSVKAEEIIPVLRPVLRRWRDERRPGERFGDFAARVLWPEESAVTTTTTAAAAS